MTQAPYISTKKDFDVLCVTGTPFGCTTPVLFGATFQYRTNAHLEPVQSMAPRGSRSSNHLDLRHLACSLSADSQTRRTWDWNMTKCDLTYVIPSQIFHRMQNVCRNRLPIWMKRQKWGIVENPRHVLPRRRPSVERCEAPTPGARPGTKVTHVPRGPRGLKNGA